MDLFALEPGLAIWTWISFAILFFIMSKFALPVVLDNLNKREEYISSAVDKTAQIEKRLGEIESERDEIIKKANDEADKILLNTRQEAEKLKQELAKKAEAEASAIIQEGQERAKLEREKMISDLQDDLSDLICNTSEKVVASAFISDKERQWTKDLVKQL